MQEVVGIRMRDSLLVIGCILVAAILIVPFSVVGLAIVRNRAYGYDHLEARGAVFIRDGSSSTAGSVHGVRFSPINGTITEKDVNALLELPNLNWLDISGDDVRAEHLRILSRHSSLEALMLRIPVDADRLSALRQLDSLKHLRITATIDEELVAALSDMRQLEVLELDMCNVDPSGGVPSFRGLTIRELAIISDSTTAADLEPVRGMTTLRRLVVYQLDLTVEAAAILTSVPQLAEVLLVHGRCACLDSLVKLAQNEDVAVHFHSCELSAECAVFAKEMDWKVSGSP